MTAELKRIGFVKTYAATATSMAGSAYATAKTFVPRQLAGTVESTEAMVMSKATPIASWAIGKGEAVLGMVDKQVRLATASRRGRGACARGARVRNARPLFREKQRGGEGERGLAVPRRRRRDGRAALSLGAQSPGYAPVLVLMTLSARDERPRALRGARADKL